MPPRSSLDGLNTKGFKKPMIYDKIRVVVLSRFRYVNLCLEGRARDGGLRFGEMGKQVNKQTSHGLGKSPNAMGKHTNEQKSR